MEDVLLGVALVCLSLCEILLYLYILHVDPKSRFHFGSDDKEDSKKKELLDNLPVDMSRTQRRLFEKQLSDFDKTFHHFSNYQLKMISDLCIDIIKERS